MLVTGGTGFLGRAIVEQLRRRGRAVRVIARRVPAEWHRIEGVDYVTGDLSDGFDPEWLRGVDEVVHCAAATSGGWAAHQAASIDATRHLIEAMAVAGCDRLLHLSSIAVVDDPGEIDESSSYLDDPRGSGPYAWGKLESERLARELASQAGMELTVVRPGAIVDYEVFDPPGRLGKRVGNLFVAVGGKKERLGVVGLAFCAEAIVQLLDSRDDSDVIHLLDPELPTRRSLVERLRDRNPGLRVVWIPRWAVGPLGLLATGLQKVLRPSSRSVDISAVFGDRRYDTSESTRLARALSARDQVSYAS